MHNNISFRSKDGNFHPSMPSLLKTKKMIGALHAGGKKLCMCSVMVEKKLLHCNWGRAWGIVILYNLSSKLHWPSPTDQLELQSGAAAQSKEL